MIHVTLKDNALWARGHSGSGPRGQDILCAAVSILMEATAAALARQYDETLILEQAVTGFEVGCAVIGNEQLYIGEVDEIELSEGFFDFSEKYL